MRVGDKRGEMGKKEGEKNPDYLKYFCLILFSFPIFSFHTFTR